MNLPPTAPRVTADWLSRYHRAAAVAMNDLFLRHLVRLYRAFEGDLVAAMVLGEVAHHNLSALRNRTRTLPGLHEAFSHMDIRAELLPTNAFSIAAATGIPRETVRRKVAYLVRRGFLLQDASADLYVAPSTAPHFEAFNLDVLNDLLATVHQVHELIASGDAESTPPR